MDLFAPTLYPSLISSSYLCLGVLKLGMVRVAKEKPLLLLINKSDQFPGHRQVAYLLYWNSQKLVEGSQGRNALAKPFKEAEQSWSTELRHTASSFLCSLYRSSKSVGCNSLISTDHMGWIYAETLHSGHSSQQLDWRKKTKANGRAAKSVWQRANCL